MRITIGRLTVLAALCLLQVLVSTVVARPAWGEKTGRTVLRSPALDYVRLFGGPRTATTASLALGGGGNVFLAGTTTSSNWPATQHPTCKDQFCPHGFVLKLRPDGSSAFYSVSLGGSRATYVNAITVDAAGNAFVVGNTTSPDFPIVRALQSHCGSTGASCSDAFVAEFSPYGSLIYSTFLGGSGQDAASSIRVDRYGTVYVGGETASSNFPTFHAVQRRLAGGIDGFVTKMGPRAGGLVYSTYLGGTQDDRVAGITVDRAGEAYVTGGTASSGFRTSSRSVQPRAIDGDCNFFRCRDAFVTKLGAAGRFLAGTFLATPADETGHAIVLDNAGNVYVGGDTGSARIPSMGAVPPTGKVLCGSEGVVVTCESAFVVELAPSLDRLLYSRILSGDGLDSANDLAVNGLGNVVVAGYTESTNFPTVNPVQGGTGGGECSEAKGGSVPCDGFVAIIAPHNHTIRFSTYLGGNGMDEVQSLALDGHGNAYLAGTTNSSNFPSATTEVLPKVFLGRITSLYR